jgi:hypothetical protein
MRKTLLIVVCYLALNTAARAAPIAPCPADKTYADYITLKACLLGDKAFSNFDLLLGPNTGAATTPKANQIAVTPLNPARNPGFTFTGTPPFHSPPPPGPPDFFSYRFLYDVRVQAGGAPITDASLVMSMPTVTADGSVTINELICLGAVFESKGICANGAPMTELRVFDTPTGVQLRASTNFSVPYRLIGTETLLIASLGTKGSASVDSFTEQFSETPARVPEPSSLALVGVGVAMLTCRRRYRG